LPQNHFVRISGKFVRISGKTGKFPEKVPVFRKTTNSLFHPAREAGKKFAIAFVWCYHTYIKKHKAPSPYHPL